MQSTVVRMCDHEVEMESDVERRKRLTRVLAQLHRRAEDDSGGSNDEWLTNRDTRSCYICKIAPYSVSSEALLRAIMYALVYYW